MYNNSFTINDDFYSNFSLRGKKYFERKRALEAANNRAKEINVLLNLPTPTKESIPTKEAEPVKDILIAEPVKDILIKEPTKEMNFESNSYTKYQLFEDIATMPYNHFGEIFDTQSIINALK